MVGAALEIREDAAERIPMCVCVCVCVCVCRTQLDPRTHHSNRNNNSYLVFEHFLCVPLCFKHIVSVCLLYLPDNPGMQATVAPILQIEKLRPLLRLTHLTGGGTRTWASILQRCVAFCYPRRAPPALTVQISWQAKALRSPAAESPCPFLDPGVPKWSPHRSAALALPGECFGKCCSRNVGGEKKPPWLLFDFGRETDVPSKSHFSQNFPSLWTTTRVAVSGRHVRGAHPSPMPPRCECDDARAARHATRLLHPAADRHHSAGVPAGRPVPTLPGPRLLLGSARAVSGQQGEGAAPGGEGPSPPRIHAWSLPGLCSL